MSSVVERLIESWLDNQSERRYQPAFIQLLVSLGWKVLHNTRHSPLEMGKDVIARNPEGQLYCFQLKGNPGGRLTKSEAAVHLVQFIELLELSPPDRFRKSQSERHIAVFVTNGNVDEEATAVFESAGKRTNNSTCAASKYEIWSRGDLISMFQQVTGSIWPTTLEGIRRLLNLLASDGRDLPDKMAFTDLLVSTAPIPTSKTKSPERAASLASLLVVTEIAKSPWYSTENHYGLFTMTVLAAVYALRFADTKQRLEIVKRYTSLALEHAADLVNEAQKHDFDPGRTWAAEDMLSEYDIMSERRNLVGECAAVLALSENSEIAVDQDYAAELVEASYRTPQLWGQAAIPSLILRYWVTTRRPGVHLERAFAKQLEAILRACVDTLPKTRPLPAPYYSFVDCWAFRNDLPFFSDDGIFTDSFEGRTWFARPMLFMLAKRNWKQTCKLIWPTFTSVVHEDVDIPDSAFFDCRHCREGLATAFTFHYREWDDLIKEAVDLEKDGDFLKPFSELSWLIAAYIALVPYRAWAGVLMWLDRRFNLTWY